MSRVMGRLDPRRRRERGAISFAAPSVLILGIFTTALAVDVGRLAWNRRQLQEIADIGAIDAMRAFGQCSANPTDPVAAAQASAVRNGYTGNLASAPNAVQIGSVTTGASGVRTFTAGGSIETATAVRVLATRQVPFTMIASSFLPGSAQLSAEAVAAREAWGAFSAGSFAARVDTSDSPLLNPLIGGLLGGPLSISGVSYEGLANASLTVGELVAAANVATVDELLALEMTAPEYMELLAEALADGGDASAAATLTTIANSANDALTVPLGEVLDIASGATNCRVRRAAERVRHARRRRAGGERRRRYLDQ